MIFDEISMQENDRNQFGSNIEDDEDNSGDFVCLDMGVEEDVDDFEGPETVSYTHLTLPTILRV